MRANSTPQQESEIANNHQAIDPNYYHAKIPEPIFVIEAWKLCYHLGSAVAYIARCNDKGERKKDLIKAANYCYRAATGEWLPKEVLNDRQTSPKTR